MTYKKTYSPCDECPHSYSKNNQETCVCKICEFKQSLDIINRQQAEIKKSKDIATKRLRALIKLEDVVGKYLEELG